MVNRWVMWDGSSEWRSFAESPAQASIAFTLGNLVLETDAASPNWWFSVDLQDVGWGSYSEDQFRIGASAFKPVAGLPGVDGVQVAFQFMDPAGYRVMDYPMPTYLPDLDRFLVSWVIISGWSSAMGQYFEVRLQMQTVRPSVAAEPTVSPAAGAFVRQQPIVPAVMLPSGTQVLGIEVSVNGVAMPAYFGGCSPAGTALRLVFVCPDINPHLAPGMNRVEWSVRFPDGSATSKAVDWEIVQ